MSVDMMVSLLSTALYETLYMVFFSGLIGMSLGAVLGVVLFCTKRGGIVTCYPMYIVLTAITNAARSIPFIILLVAIIPVTRFIVGTSIGTASAIVPLALGTIPFVGRIVENALAEISSGLIEAAWSMGATPVQIVWRFLLPEALPAIINGLTVTVVLLVSYSAMAGAVGGGGLGDLGIRYGYQRFNFTMMAATVVILIILVQCLQWVGDRISRQFNKR